MYVKDVIISLIRGGNPHIISDIGISVRTPGNFLSSPS